MTDQRVVSVEGKEIAITNPEKMLYPSAGITKWDYVLHLTRLAPYLLPHSRRRFLTTIRYPHGTGDEFFYQKNVPSHAPDWIPTARDGKVTYILLEDTPTLVWLANLACLEFHLSFNLVDDPDHPPELVFDLDPSVEGFGRVMEVALLTREVLNQLDLDALVKTSGATGLQLYIPLKGRFTFEQTRRVSHFIARYLEEKHPRLITLERIKKNRGDKVYFDYLQHWRGKSLIAPYSPRAREQATVSTPLKWSELRPGLVPEQFTLPAVHRRLAETGDLFQPLLSRENRFDLSRILDFVERKRK
ncbi:bifunctional non-homologous end joining protein LigD [Planifilum fimeticola]|jgi:bifunctional non-homologous end joining protein LigD|uniref:Bifunctional non-homologous end joining protein LigD n=1 Tax=Planifilum fimeticola TaxID=201975 RepID=A0A2T0LDC5_9BACL|nr:non-homologous end-joining DNA ligase [Planifilum fimeticola]PRX40033.1 bifunctional non-homologous end joining protein LigD [Planifilum fimeticola]